MNKMKNANKGSNLHLKVISGSTKRLMSAKDYFKIFYYNKVK